MNIADFEENSGICLALFQHDALHAIKSGASGLIVAPTGSGKTLAVSLPFFLDHPGTPRGIELLWITPLRALSRDTGEALVKLAKLTGFQGDISVRSSDTGATQRKKQLTKPPSILVTTPESLHVLLSYAGSTQYFNSLSLIVVDEWHELYGTKRGVQVELGICLLRQLNPKIQIWGMSATIPNAEEALIALTSQRSNRVIIRSSAQRDIKISLVAPETLARFPWAGHIGLSLLPKVLEIIRAHSSVLIFTNTRSHTERWFQALLEAEPDLAGVLAIHHGSLDPNERDWVEGALRDGKLKAVVCTSSLDLGVDFSPVDAVVQIGSPKDAARLVQRAGRSGHSPGLSSVLYFVPTNSLEVIEYEALKRAVEDSIMGSKRPVPKPLDVLIQFLVTLSCGDGIDPKKLFLWLKTTKSYEDLTSEEYQWALTFVTTGGETLRAYEEYRKCIFEEGLLKISSPARAKQHRMSIGTIVSDPSIAVKFQRGKTLGTVEESFISKLRPGDVFLLGGRTLEYLRLREFVLTVKRASSIKTAVPRWLGGRLSLSTEYAEVLRSVLADIEKDPSSILNGLLNPLLSVQKKWSAVPGPKQLLVELIDSREGHHIFLYPFEGRAVHEGLGMILAERISRLRPVTFSVASNDYGIELLSAENFAFTETELRSILSPKGVEEDCLSAMNASEIARRKFKEIARISGLTFSGYPGREKSEKYVMASAQLIYDVFMRYDPQNLLIKQSFEEALHTQLYSDRIISLLKATKEKKLIIKKPPRFTPFAFPLVVDRLREKVSSEKLDQRIQRLIAENEKLLEEAR